jgi:hypothetical protein
VDDDPALAAEWLEVTRMVTEHSNRFRAEIMRVLDQWKTVEGPEFRNQGLREMAEILSYVEDLIRAELLKQEPGAR